MKSFSAISKASSGLIFEGKKAVIFDFDGTIADTFCLHKAAFEKALENYNVSFDYSDYLGMSTDETLEEIFKKNQRIISKEELIGLVNTKRLLANQSYQTSLKAIPGALEFIDLLHKHNMQLFIGSSGSQMNVNTGLKSLGIHSKFKEVFTSNNVKKSKPDPEIFQIILDKYQIYPQQALVIEDAVSGIKAAYKAGIEVVCVNAEIYTSMEVNEKAKCHQFIYLIKAFELHIENEQSISSHRNL